MKRLVLLGIMTTSAAFAHTGVKNPEVMARMADMKDMASVLKTLGAMAKSQTDFDVISANEGFDMIARDAAAIPDVFANPETDPKSEALPVIWNRFDDFSAKARELETVAAGFAGNIAALDDLAPALEQVGAACKSCHTSYRQ